MRKEGNIDDIFKDKLSDLEVVPSDAVWGRIESDLDNKPRRKFWIFLPVVLLISLMVIGGFLYEKPVNSNDSLSDSATKTEQTNTGYKLAELKGSGKQNITPVSASEASEPSGRLIASELSGNSKQNTSKSIASIEQANEPEKTKAQNKPIENNKGKTAKNPNTTNPAKEGESSAKPIDLASNSVAAVTLTKRKKTNPTLVSVESKNQIDNREVETVSSDLNSAFEPEFITTLSAGFPALFPLLKQKTISNKEKENSRQWMVGLTGGVNGNFKHLNYDSQAQLMVLDSSLSREMNTTTFSYGAIVAVKWKKHWRVTSGISYSKWCRKAVYPLDIPIDPNTIAGSPFEDYTKELVGSTGGQNVNVPNEQISNYETLAPMPSNLEFDLQVHECYEIISIPLRVGYEVFFSEFSLVPEIGLSYNRVVGNTLEADASNDLDPVDFERYEEYNKNMLSFSGSLGIERYLSPQFKIGVNGAYDYAITPLYQSNQFSTHPYTISGQVRVWYIFSK